VSVFSVSRHTELSPSERCDVRIGSRLWLTLVGSLLGAAISPVLAFAQSPTQEAFNALGFQKSHNYFSPESFEHYDTATGNVMLTFTDLTLPGNAGRSLQFQRIYNNKRWASSEPTPTQTSRWSFGFPRIVMRILEVPRPVEGGVECCESASTLRKSGVQFLMADGGLHPTAYSMRTDTSTAELAASTTHRPVASGSHWTGSKTYSGTA
jgi:hypothetical protein